MTLGIWGGTATTGGPAFWFGAIALICVVSWPQIESYRKAVVLQSVGAAAFAFQFAFLDAWTASATSALSLGQLVCFSWARDPKCVRVVSSVSIVTLVLISVSTWQGLPSLLAICGSLMGLIARLQPSTTRMKIVFVAGAPFWVLHNIAVGAVFALCIDAVSILGNSSSLARTARRNGWLCVDPAWLTSRVFQLPPAAIAMSTSSNC